MKLWWYFLHVNVLATLSNCVAVQIEQSTFYVERFVQFASNLLVPLIHLNKWFMPLIFIFTAFSMNVNCKLTSLVALLQCKNRHFLTNIFSSNILFIDSDWKCLAFFLLWFLIIKCQKYNVKSRLLIRMRIRKWMNRFLEGERWCLLTFRRRISYKLFKWDHVLNFAVWL